jgi:CubicO group peptidase (beta-lactamase class C family)
MNRRQVMMGGAATAVAGCASTRAVHLEAETLDAFLEANVGTMTSKRMGVLLCDANGPFYARSLGEDRESTHLLASATKLASTTAIMSCVDSGLVHLDDPIGKHLPQFGPNRRIITIRQLLSQTHGLPFTHDSIPQPQAANGMTLAQSVNLIAKEDTLEFAPGSQHKYQPAVSYHIAGRICEVVTHKSWEELFDERVGKPLEMATFTYGDTPNPRIGGGAKCALRDYGNLVQMHVANGVFKDRRILSQTSVAEMQKDQLHGVKFTQIPRISTTVGYGLSWWFDSLQANGEARLISVPGAFAATPWIDRQHRYGGFLLVEEPGVRLGDVNRFYRTLVDFVNKRLV